MLMFISFLILKFEGRAGPPNLAEPPLGVYSFAATVTYSSQKAASGTSTFTVQ